MIFIFGNLKPYNWWKYLKPYNFTQIIYCKNSYLHIYFFCKWLLMYLIWKHMTLCKLFVSRVVTSSYKYLQMIFIFGNLKPYNWWKYLKAFNFTQIIYCKNSYLHIYFFCKWLSMYLIWKHMSLCKLFVSRVVTSSYKYLQMIFIFGNLKPYNWWKYLKPYNFTQIIYCKNSYLHIYFFCKWLLMYLIWKHMSLCKLFVSRVVTSSYKYLQMIFIFGNLKPYNWWKYLKPYNFTQIIYCKNSYLHIYFFCKWLLMYLIWKHMSLCKLFESSTVTSSHNEEWKSRNSLLSLWLDDDDDDDGVFNVTITWHIKQKKKEDARPKIRLERISRKKSRRAGLGYRIKRVQNRCALTFAFEIILLGKVWIPLYPKLWVKWFYYWQSTRMDLTLDNSRILICLLTRTPKNKSEIDI